MTILYDKNTAIEILKKNPIKFRTMDKSLRDDKDVVLTAVGVYSDTFKNVSKRLRDDKDVALLAVKQSGMNLLHVSNRLADDIDVVSAAINQVEVAIAYAGEKLKNNKEVVLIALKKNKSVHGFIGQALKDELKGVDNPVEYLEKQILYEKIKLKHDAVNLSLIKQHADNKDYVLNALKDNGLLLEHLSERLKNNPSVCIVAVSQNKDAQKFIGETLKDCVGVNVKSTLSRLSKVKYVEPVDEKIEVKQDKIKRVIKI